MKTERTACVSVHLPPSLSVLGQAESLRSQNPWKGATRRLDFVVSKGITAACDSYVFVVHFVIREIHLLVNFF